MGNSKIFLYQNDSSRQIFPVPSSIELSRPVVVCNGRLPICLIWAFPWANAKYLTLTTYPNNINLDQLNVCLCTVVIIAPLHRNVCGQNRVRSVTSTILTGSISYLHTLSSNFRCVRCKVFLQNSKIWIFGKFFKFVTLTLSCFDLGSDMNQ